MYFRTELGVRDLEFGKVPSGGFEITLGGPHKISVTVRQSVEGEMAGRRGLYWRAISEQEPNDRVKRVLEDLIELRVPEGSQIPDNHEGRWFLEGEGRLKAKRPLPLSMLPEGTKQFVNDVRTELRQAIYKSVRVLRWRWGLPGSHNPFSGGTIRDQYSLDAETWYSLPATFYARALPHGLLS